MRFAAISAATLIAAAATAASAAPASVQVLIGPDLQKKAEKTYGVRDVNQLASDLQRAVTRAAARNSAYDDARIELTLVDAQPNRPTFKQMGDTVGLSAQSFGIGGAKIEGRITGANGVVTPVSYKWYETDIRWAAHRTTWQDAEDAFGRFAYRLNHGQQLASR